MHFCNSTGNTPFKMFTEEGASIVKYYPSKVTLKIRDTKPPCKLFLTTFQKRNKTREDMYESKGKKLQGKDTSMNC